MLKSKSLKKLTAMSVGLVIALSSCGLQNESSESAPAAGKTKNFTLTAEGYCYENWFQYNEEYHVAAVAWGANFENWLQTIFYNDNDNQDAWDAFYNNYWAPFNNPYISESGCVPIVNMVNTPSQSGPQCVKPDVKKEIIAGYNEQLARPLGGEVTEEYIAKMKKGLEVSQAMCTN